MTNKHDDNSVALSIKFCHLSLKGHMVYGECQSVVRMGSAHSLEILEILTSFDTLFRSEVFMWSAATLGTSLEYDSIYTKLGLTVIWNDDDTVFVW